MTDRIDNGLDVLKEKLAGYLQDNGLRFSAERNAILETIYSMDCLFTPAQLLEAVSERQNFLVSRATVYNNLRIFESVGLVQKVLLDGSVKYDRGWHGNCSTRLVCTRCMKAWDSHDDRLDTLVREMKLRRFHMAGYTLYIHGLCSGCMQAAKRKKKSNRTKI